MPSLLTSFVARSEEVISTAERSDFIEQFAAIGDEFRSEAREWSELISDIEMTLHRCFDEPKSDVRDEWVREMWRICQNVLRKSITHETRWRSKFYSMGIACAVLRTMKLYRDYRFRVEAWRVARRRIVDLMRTTRAVSEVEGLEVDSDLADEYRTVHIPAAGYIRSMLTLAWESIRHPMSECTIDLETGKVVARTHP